MPTVSLANVLKHFKTTSLRNLFLQIGATDRSIFGQAQIAAIDTMYRINNKFRGPFGFPLGDVEFNGESAGRLYSGGQIRFLDNSPQGGDVMTVVRVRYVGFTCLEESSWDQGSSSDEPYFIIGVAGASGSNTVRCGPYDGVNSGDQRYEARLIASENDKITPPIVLGIVAMEHDEGSPDEAEEKVRNIVKGLEREFDQAGDSFTGIGSGNHVMPDWARTLLIGWLPEGVAAVLGLADDDVGSNQVVLFDNKADLKEWKAPPIIGKHGENEYNIKVNIDGGSSGKYDIFFKVDLFKDPSPQIVPYQ
jgi:hypothetical protein